MNKMLKGEEDFVIMAVVKKLGGQHTEKLMTLLERFGVDAHRKRPLPALIIDDECDAEGSVPLHKEIVAGMLKKTGVPQAIDMLRKKTGRFQGPNAEEEYKLASYLGYTATPQVVISKLPCVPPRSKPGFREYQGRCAFGRPPRLCARQSGVPLRSTSVIR